MEYVKIGISIVSAMIALLTFLQNRRIKKDLVATLWKLFKNQQNGFSVSQGAVETYKRDQTNLNPHILHLIAKSEGFDQTMLEDILYQIYVHDKNLNQDKIDKYFAEEKISIYDKKFLEILMNEPVTPTFLQKIYKLLGIPV